MNRALINSLGEQDRLLLAETEPAHLSELDEDGLIDLHKLVRKRRNKYRSMYRRKGAAKVKKSGGRGKAKQKNKRNADRLEAFEDALARVSRARATAARQSAAELRTERIAAARAAKASPTGGTAKRSSSARSSRSNASGATARTNARKSPRTRKATAATRASGARRQAARDSR